LDSGVMLTYEGAYGVNMELRVSCDLSGSTTSIPIDPDSPIVYHLGTENGEWGFSSSSALVCPKRFEVPVPPENPTPSPTPNPKYKPEYTKQARINGYTISLDLTKQKYTSEPVVLGYGSSYHKAEIMFSPNSLIKCPTGYKCPENAQEANVFKCINTEANPKFCWPVGDARYGLTMSVYNESDPYSGISVNYDGGYGGYEIHFNYQCNLSVPVGEINFDETGVQTRQNSIVIFAHTQEICPIAKRDAVSFGGVFLFVILFGISLYFFIGLILNLLTGIVSIPNEGFWIEFKNCIVDGVIFVFTCGKGSSGNYSTI